jgi:hypothetical protein
VPPAGSVDGKERAFRDRTSIGAHGGAGDVDREVRGTHDGRLPILVRRRRPGWRPARAVTTPAAAARPCMSSGEIGGHTRMTGPSRAIWAALSAVVATLPAATPGQAPSPRVRMSALSVVTTGARGGVGATVGRP